MRPVVLLHGYTGSPASFRATLAQLPPDAPVVTPTLPGHDDTPPPTALGDAFRAIDSALTRLGERAHVLGYSLGGRMALHFTLAHPERVARLTLLGARPGIGDPHERASRRASDRRWSELLRVDGLEPFLEQWEAQALLQPRTTDAEAIAEARAIRRRHSAAGLAAAMDVFSVAALPDLWPRLAELNVPVTWASGEHDTHYRALMQHAAERIGEHTSIRGAGHSVLVDNPAAIAELAMR